MPRFKNELRVAESPANLRRGFDALSLHVEFDLLHFRSGQSATEAASHFPSGLEMDPKRMLSAR